MLVLVMDVRQMPVRMFRTFVCMFVAVFASWHGVVSVRMVPVVVVVRMGVRFRRVNVWMNVFFRDGEISAQQHDCKRGKKQWCWRFAKEQKGEQHAKKWRCGIVSAGSGCSKISLGVDVKVYAEAVGHKAQSQRAKRARNIP